MTKKQELQQRYDLLAKEMNELKKQIKELEPSNKTELTEVQEAPSCRMEKLGKYAVPICGHDVITEFMVGDLRKGPNKSLLLYAGLHADDHSDRFFWYVSTMRTITLKKIAAFARGGKIIRRYLQNLLTNNSLELLLMLHEEPKNEIEILGKHTQHSIENLKNLNLIKEQEDGIFTVTTKGVEVCCILTHLSYNHQVKPELPHLQEIFRALASVGLDPNTFLLNPDDLMTVKKGLKLLEDQNLLTELEKKGISILEIETVIRDYLCPPY
ncbi:MAG: hypothetical protein ACFFBD_04165 [Candidatus Hodarchaeota archaeon]